MSVTVSREFTVIRLVESPFATDPDWGATNDIAAAKAADAVSTFVPLTGTLGRIEYLVAFWDDLQTPVAVPSNARIEFDVDVIVESPLFAPSMHGTAGGVVGVDGGLLTRSEAGLFTTTEVALRFVTLINLPTANFMAVMARIE
jgi:hypothetical protein